MLTVGPPRGRAQAAAAAASKAYQDAIEAGLEPPPPGAAHVKRVPSLALDDARKAFTVFATLPSECTLVQTWAQLN